MERKLDENLQLTVGKTLDMQLTQEDQKERKTTQSESIKEAKELYSRVKEAVHNKEGCFTVLGGGSFGKTDIGYGMHIVNVKDDKEKIYYKLYTELGLVFKEVRNDKGALTSIERVEDKEKFNQIKKAIENTDFSKKHDDQSNEIVKRGLEKAESTLNVELKKEKNMITIGNTEYKFSSDLGVLTLVDDELSDILRLEITKK